VEKTKVPGERCLHGDFGGFHVANFADEDDVGVMAENGAQTKRERKAGFVGDLDLVDPRS